MTNSEAPGCIYCAARQLRCDARPPECSRCKQECRKCSYSWVLGDDIFALFQRSANQNKQVVLHPHARPEGKGGFGQVYKALSKNGQYVAVKVLFERDAQLPSRALELAVREAWTWSQLNHRNIVPFLGIANYEKICHGARAQLCLISPWINLGNIMDVVRAGPTAPRLPLLRDLTEGLMYLHTHKPSPIVHGDIRGGNVLIDVVEGRRVARLTDFGLAHVVESVEEQRTNSTTMMRAGNARWLAFERMMPEKYNLSNPRDAKSPKSDIFELMRTFYEVLIGQAPFHGLNDFAAIAAVQEKQNPERPGEDLAPELDAEMWRLMEQAWSVKRNARPRLSEILDYFDSRSDIRKMDVEREMNLQLFQRVMDTPAMKRRLFQHWQQNRLWKIAMTLSYQDYAEEAAAWELLSRVPPSQWESLTLTTNYAAAMSRVWLLLVMGTPPHMARKLRRLHLCVGTWENAWIGSGDAADDSDSKTIPPLLASTIQDFAPRVEILHLLNTPVRWTNLVEWPLWELRLDHDRQVPEAVPTIRQWIDLSRTSPRLELLFIDGQPFMEDHQTELQVKSKPNLFRSLKMLSLSSMSEEAALQFLRGLKTPALQCLILACRLSRTSRPLSQQIGGDQYAARLTLGNTVARFRRLHPWTSKLTMLSLKEPAAAISGILSLLEVLPSLEVLDASIVHFEDFKQDPSQTYSPRLSVLRTRNTKLAWRLDAWTQRQFIEISKGLEAVLELQLPAVTILKAYRDYLPDSDRALYYVAQPSPDGNVRHRRYSNPLSPPILFEPLGHDLFSW